MHGPRLVVRSVTVGTDDVTNPETGVKLVSSEVGTAPCLSDFWRLLKCTEGLPPLTDRGASQSCHGNGDGQQIAFCSFVVV